MGPGTVLEVHNLSDKEFVDSWGNTVWRIPAGGKNIVPFEAVCLWFGHPEAVDLDPRNMFRHEEHMRMRVKYGVYEKDELESTNFPTVRVFDLDGTPVTTVVQDPSGTTLSKNAAELTERRALQEQMAELHRQLEVMQAYVNSQQGEGAVSVPVPETTPDAPPVGPTPTGVPIVTPPVLSEGDPGNVEVLEDSPDGGTRVRVS